MKNSSLLTQEQIKELKNLSKHKIDYSDIPQTTDFSNAKFKYYKLEPIKKTVTMRLDADLLAILKSFGKGYQSKANEILRSVIIDHKMPNLF